MLLFKVGLLTLLNIDSFMFLAKLFPSLPIIWNFQIFIWINILEVPNKYLEVPNKYFESSK